ncbi:hypothetical protein ACXYMO_09060 [Arenibacterium sp. CAU 1754]
MIAALTVSAREHGIVRLFHLNTSPEQARFLQQENAAVADILGLDQVDPDYAEVFALSDLEELGLPGYLIEGCGIPADVIAADRERLGALTGWVLVLFSKAFGGRDVRLTPAEGVDLVAQYSETPTDWTATPIKTESAKPGSGPTRIAPRQARADARRIGGTIFAVFMLIIAVILLAIFF